MGIIPQLFASATNKRTGVVREWSDGVQLTLALAHPGGRWLLRLVRVVVRLHHRVVVFFVLVLLVLSVNLLGDWLRDALNPKLR